MNWQGLAAEGDGVANRFFGEALPNVSFLLTFLQSTLISQEERSIVSWWGRSGGGGGGTHTSPSKLGEGGRSYPHSQLAFICKGVTHSLQ